MLERLTSNVLPCLTKWFMATRKEILILYKLLLKESRKFTLYNYRYKWLTYKLLNYQLGNSLKFTSLRLNKIIYRKIKKANKNNQTYQDHNIPKFQYPKRSQFYLFEQLVHLTSHCSKNCILLTFLVGTSKTPPSYEAKVWSLGHWGS